MIAATNAGWLSAQKPDKLLCGLEPGRSCWTHASDDVQTSINKVVPGLFLHPEPLGCDETQRFAERDDLLRLTPTCGPRNFTNGWRACSASGRSKNKNARVLCCSWITGKAWSTLLFHTGSIPTRSLYWRHSYGRLVCGKSNVEAGVYFTRDRSQVK